MTRRDLSRLVMRGGQSRRHVRGGAFIHGHRSIGEADPWKRDQPSSGDALKFHGCDALTPLDLVAMKFAESSFPTNLAELGVGSCTVVDTCHGRRVRLRLGGLIGLVGRFSPSLVMLQSEGHQEVNDASSMRATIESSLRK